MGHAGPLEVATVDRGIGVVFTEAVWAPTFGVNVLSAGVLDKTDATTVLGPDARLTKGEISLPLRQFGGLDFLDFRTASSPGGLAATRSRTTPTAPPTLNAPRPHAAPTFAPAPTPAAPTLAATLSTDTPELAHAAQYIEFFADAEPDSQ